MSEVRNISVNESNVVIKYKQKTRSVMAKILGREVINQEEHIYLDRRVHRIGETQLGDFKCRGAITTILSKRKLENEGTAYA